MSQELLNCPWERWGNVGTVEFTTDGIVLIDNTTGTGTNWIRTSYIDLPTNTGKVYQYDFDVSITANNQVFIQVERFDAQKNTINNNGAINCIGGIKPATDLIHQRYRGTISINDLSSIQPTTMIRARIGCGYQSTTGTFIIHSWSLKPIVSQSGQTLISNPLVQKNGQIIGDNFRENYTNAAFYKDGLIEGQHFYEY